MSSNKKIHAWLHEEPLTLVWIKNFNCLKSGKTFTIFKFMKSSNLDCFVSKVNFLLLQFKLMIIATRSKQFVDWKIYTHNVYTLQFARKLTPLISSWQKYRIVSLSEISHIIFPQNLSQLIRKLVECFQIMLSNLRRALLGLE